ncbi:hypothetical protein M9H77_12034 [Catharanthus roseus]|uniref:Uncharacterized protein n=1 Tax=Catharanthus roseus TaxID=4058 RepID=A0ACC0BGC4_CATRO|nr:hypothetical protein M9H77_12034 [Catharanthus roseus]
MYTRKFIGIIVAKHTLSSTTQIPILSHTKDTFKAILRPPIVAITKPSNRWKLVYISIFFPFPFPSPSNPLKPNSIKQEKSNYKQQQSSSFQNQYSSSSSTASTSQSRLPISLSSLQNSPCHLSISLFLFFISQLKLHSTHLLQKSRHDLLDLSQLSGSITTYILHPTIEKEEEEEENRLGASVFFSTFCATERENQKVHNLIECLSSRRSYDNLTRWLGRKCTGCTCLHAQKYYLVDDGYSNQPGFLAPYREENYHRSHFRESDDEENVSVDDSIGIWNVPNGYQYHLGSSHNELAAWAQFRDKIADKLWVDLLQQS